MKTTKRWICLILSLALMCALLPQAAVPVRAAETSGKCGDNLSWRFDENTGKLTITGSGYMWDMFGAAPCPWESLIESIKTVIIENGVKSIGDGAFHKCKSMTGITIPNSVERIGVCSFMECNNLTDVVIPNKIKAICPGSFCGCSSLTSIQIPNSVEEIGDEAFLDCSSLISIIIPSSVSLIEEAAFACCNNLKEIIVINGNNYYCSDQGVLFNKEKTRLIQFPGGKAGKYQIPESVVSIENYAFIDSINLTSVLLPDGVTNIGIEAFSGCNGLTSIIIPNNVIDIGAGAFGYSSNLASILILNADCSIYDDESTLGSPNTTIILGYPSSTAEAYAKKYDYQFKEIDQQTGFTDVAKDAYYAHPVVWAVEKGVTNGTSPTTFSPDATCTRGQVVTFLWRANESPESASSESPFVDVKNTKAAPFYFNAVLWAVENKITSGLDKTHFGPDVGCTRGQVVTFLWRAAGSPEPKNMSNPFKDVKEGAYYYKAVLWAVENQVTNGMTKDTFSPDATCTRGQIVTFLYRAMEQN